MIKTGTFCTGIGSPEFALEELGTEHELVFGCEIDKYARASYLSRFKPKIMLEDMTQVDFSNPELYADLVIAGLPCQAFSIAGKRLGELDKRGVLIYNFHDYVKKQQPKAFILENVKGLKSINKGEIFENWQRILGKSVNGKPIENMHPDSLGYNLHWKVLNTKNFDLPQNRERIFIVGIRADIPNIYSFPENRELKIRLKDILEQEVDQKYYLSDKALEYLQRDSTGNWSDRMSMLNHEDKQVAGAGALTANHSKGVPYNMLQVAGAAIRGRNPDNPKSRVAGLPTEQMVEINNNPDLSNCLSTVQKDNVVLQVVGNIPGGNEMRTRVYDEAGLCPCITAKQGGGHEPMVRIAGWHENENIIAAHMGDDKRSTVSEHVYHKPEGICNTIQTAHVPKIIGHRIRKLTPLECWRLQGYSDEYFYQAKRFSKHGSKTGMSDTQLYKQTGNSISTTVIKAVQEPLINLLELSDII